MNATSSYSSTLSAQGNRLNSPIWGLCATECFTLIIAKVTISLLSTAFSQIFFFYSILPHPVHSEAILPNTQLRVCHFRLCFHLVWLFRSIIKDKAFVLCHRALHLKVKACFNDRNTALGALCRMSRPWLFQWFRRWFMVASSSSRKFLPLSLSSCSILPMVLPPLKTAQAPHASCLPTFDSVHNGSAPRPALTPKTEHAVNSVHHAYAFYSPRYIFALVNDRFSPPSFESFPRNFLAFSHSDWRCLPIF